MVAPSPPPLTEVLDVYTILAIVCLSLIALFFVVRIFLLLFSCSLTVEQVPVHGEHASAPPVKPASAFRRFCCTRSYRCCFTWVSTMAILTGASYLIFYLVVRGSMTCNTTATVGAGGVVIADGCTILRQVNQTSVARRRRLNGVHDKRRLSFADVSRSIAGWEDPPLAYWTNNETSYSPFANQIYLPDLEEFRGTCKPQRKVSGCKFYYEDIGDDGKVRDITNFNNDSMQDVMMENLYDFSNFYKESGDSCESRVASYDQNDFRDRFECGAKSYNDGNRFINPFEVEMIREGDVGIMTLPGGFFCPGGVRVFDVSVYPVVYIEMLAHFYNIFVDLSNSTDTAIHVTYDYTPRSWNDMVQTQFLPCVTRESVVNEVQRLALETR